MSEPPESPMTATELMAFERGLSRCTMDIQIRMPDPNGLLKMENMAFQFDFEHLRNRMASEAVMLDPMLGDAAREHRMRELLEEYLMGVAKEIMGPLSAHFAKLHDHFYGLRNRPTEGQLRSAIYKGLRPYPEEFDDL